MSKIVKTIDGHQGDLLYIKDNTAFIKESNGEVWYCPKTDIIDEISERDLFRDLFLDTIKEIVETNNWDGDKDKKIEYLQSQLDQQKAMWNELKESIQKERKYNATIYERDDIAIEHIEASKVLLKMQELEQGGENEN